MSRCVLRSHVVSTGPVLQKNASALSDESGDGAKNDRVGVESSSALIRELEELLARSRVARGGRGSANGQLIQDAVKMWRERSRGGGPEVEESIARVLRGIGIGQIGLER